MAWGRSINGATRADAYRRVPSIVLSRIEGAPRRLAIESRAYCENVIPAPPHLAYHRRPFTIGDVAMRCYRRSLRSTCVLACGPQMYGPPLIRKRYRGQIVRENVFGLCVKRRRGEA